MDYRRLPEQPPLYVKPLHLERARDHRSRKANTTAQPSFVLVVPDAASDPQLRKFGFVGASDYDAEFEKRAGATGRVRLPSVARTFS